MLHDIYVNVYIGNYIYKQIRIETYFLKILYSFIETHFLTNENHYGRSHSLRRDTYVHTRLNCSLLLYVCDIPALI